MGTSQLMIKSLKGQQLSEHEVYSINNNEVRGLLHLDVVQKIILLSSFIMLPDLFHLESSFALH